MPVRVPRVPMRRPDLRPVAQLSRPRVPARQVSMSALYWGRSHVHVALIAGLWVGAFATAVAVSYLVTAAGAALLALRWELAAPIWSALAGAALRLIKDSRRLWYEARTQWGVIIRKTRSLAPTD